ncbi:MAG: flagellar hook-basal body complex protein FliE [Pseudomonadota bacterium]
MSGINSIVSNAAIQGAYQTSQDLKSRGANTQDAGATNFSEMVRDASVDALDTVRKAEQAAAAGMRGDMSTQAVVEATMDMETSLRVAVSVRDKVVQAYQEIMRMPI